MIETDVIIVGGGGSGLAAAIEAARLGRRVVLLEKEDRLGGSTAWSVGSISATGTWQQKAHDIADHPDAHFEDLELLAGSMANRDNLELRRVLVDNTTETMRWLEDLGLVFTGPNEEPPHRVARMHNVLPNSRAFPAILGRACRDLGVDIRLQTCATRLLTDDRTVIGVEATHADGRKQCHRAAGGVVLAGGDYSASRELKHDLAGPETAMLEAVNPCATGDAIRIARDIGCPVVNGDIVRGPIIRFIPPMRASLLRRLPPNRALARCMRHGLTILPNNIKRRLAMGFLTTALGPSRELFEAGAILVNRSGQRFCNELENPAAHVPRQPEGLAYIILDGAMARQFMSWPFYVSTAPGIAYAYLDDYRRNRPDIFRETSDVTGLARALGAPADTLMASLSEQNRESAGGEGRFRAGPFIALGPVRSYVVFTDGGLKVTLAHEVVGGDGSPVPGLFAAGSTGQGGLLLEGHGHHLAWAFISGRRAGRYAALGTAPVDIRAVDAKGQ